MECIILAGGLGTRLQGVTEGPKCMALVNGRPFLSYLFDYLDRQGCTRAILSLGYKHKVITDWLELQEDIRFEIDYIIENTLLGTGGGILAAIEEAETDDVAVVNGDTLFQADIRKQMAFHKANNAAVTLALKEMHDFDRYGIVDTDAQGVITAFHEKQHRDAGLINGGVYIINRERYMAKQLQEKFSFEKDYLERYAGENSFYGFKSDGYFIDIGIPEDYARAQEDFKSMKL